jgi:hypothetical protein
VGDQGAVQVLVRSEALATSRGLLARATASAADDPPTA